MKLSLELRLGNSPKNLNRLFIISNSILSQYANPETSEIVIDDSVSTKDLVNILPFVSSTISAGAKPLKFMNYTDNVRTLMDIPANENGNDTELLAWLIDELYANYVNVWINLQSVGVARDNIHVSGELPAVFTVTSGDGTNYVRVQVSETTTVTPAGGTSIKIGSSGDFVTTPLTIAANTIQDIYFSGAGSFIIPRRKQITYLNLYNLGSSVITGDITGMGLTYLYLYNIGSSVITGDITGMKLTYLRLYSIGSSVITGDITGMELTFLSFFSLGSSAITGDITGMKLTYLRLQGLSSSSVITGDITGMKLTYLQLYKIGSSTITGDITGMELTFLYLNNIGSSLTYGTNSLNITHSWGIQLLGDTVFATATEYERLIHDAAIATWSGAYPFVITEGTTENCPDWDTVKADVAVLLTKASWTIIPSAWLSDNGGSWPADWNEYTGE